MKNRTRKIIMGMAIVLAAVSGYLCWPEKKVPMPKNAIVLDKTRIESKDFYLLEENFSEDMERLAEPYLNERKNTGYFKGYDGEKLYYEQYQSEENKGHIVIIHGFTDAAYKFREVIYYFLKNGYSVSVMEHRGHGYSYRSLENLSKITINDFDEYKDDLKIFLSDVVRPTLQEEEKLFAYAHSMGGGIAALLLEEDSSWFDAVVLTSPMMEIEFAGIPNRMAELITKGTGLLGMDEEYILGMTDYEEVYDFENSSLTSKARYDYLVGISAKDVNYQMSGGSYKWLAAAIDATQKILKNAQSYTTDTLLFQAENDTTVGPNGQNEFAEKASNVQLILVEDAKHNILFTENETFIPYMNMILEFFESHLN